MDIIAKFYIHGVPILENPQPLYSLKKKDLARYRERPYPIGPCSTTTKKYKQTSRRFGTHRHRLRDVTNHSPACLFV